MDSVKISEMVTVGETRRGTNGQRNLELCIQDIVDFEKNTVRSSLVVDVEHVGENDEPVYTAWVTLSPKTVAALKDYFIAFLAGEKSHELEPSDDGA